MTAPADPLDGALDKAVSEAAAARSAAEGASSSQPEPTGSPACGPQPAYSTNDAEPEAAEENKPVLTTDPEAARDDSIGQMVEPENS